MSEPVPANRQAKNVWIYIAIFIVTGIIVFVLIGPITPPVSPSTESATIQMCRQIDLAMFSYATDHNGNYPDGNSSTEVFQKLIDGGYISDPSIFFVREIPGKVAPSPTGKLKPENVCFDVTSGVTSSSPDQLPVVFLTGFKITYSTGVPAIPLSHSGSSMTDDGIAVAYHSNSARFLMTESSGSAVNNVVPTTFVPDGKTYRQLTPTGPLP